MKIRSRCKCGRVKNQYSFSCTKCFKERHAVCIVEAQKIVAGGKCPKCGTKLVYNNAIAGWWQCGAYACESFRKPEFRGLRNCSFQTFTA